MESVDPIRFLGNNTLFILYIWVDRKMMASRLAL